MNFRFLPAACTAVLLAAATAPSLARPAVLLADAELLAGPGKEETLVAAVAEGTIVDLRRCEEFRWCFINAGGTRGWVPRSLLGFDLPAGTATGTGGSVAPVAGTGAAGVLPVAKLLDGELAYLPGPHPVLTTTPPDTSDQLAKTPALVTSTPGNRRTFVTP
ncbi:MAG TPA: SH3 domain-containing protein [Devosia sp.]|nr:SH3 domain-containing protein [Devosia sp.]